VIHVYNLIIIINVTVCGIVEGIGLLKAFLIPVVQDDGTRTFLCEKLLSET
jgi:hypothetical protein